MKKILVLALAAVATSSFAGVWNEVGDAIDLVPGQQTIGAGSLDAISGNLDANDVDMYCINIVDEAHFSASLIGGATFDSQMWLFNEQGFGVAFNDDGNNGASLQSALSSLLVNSNGHYLLAVSKYDRDAVDGAGAALWNDSPFGSERAPDGPGAANALAGWTGSTTAGGSYRIALTGTEYCAVPEPGTIAALGLGAAVLLRRKAKKA